MSDPPANTWNVQDDQKNGAYGLDYLGLGDTLIAQIQLHFNLPQPCTIQYQQQMSTNSESSTGNDTPYATNNLVFTLGQTTETVSRGGVAATQPPQSVHF